MGHAEKSDMELTTLICPKCGYEQEERLDCLKCGIVFSKFHALHVADKVPQAEVPEVPPLPPMPSEDPSSFDLAELRQQVRDLGRQFTAVEFERVERTQIRSDLRTLNKKVQSALDALTQRLEALEKVADEPPAPPPVVQPDRAELIQELKDNYLDLLHRRLDLIEAKLEERAASSEPQTDPWILESLGKLDQRIGSLEDKVQSLSAAVASANASGVLEELQNRLQDLKAELDILRPETDLGKEHSRQISDLQDQTNQVRERLLSCEATLEQVSRYPAGELSREPIEADVRSIRESLEQIRQFILRLDLKV